MTFAQVPFEAIQALKGLRYQLFTIVIAEEFEGGGVCKLSAAELSAKWKALENESNTARLRKQMIKEGLFIEVVGGIVTKKFNTTAKIAVEEQKELQKLQSTAKIAVNEENELQKLQESTAKIAGTEIANKDLYFKDNLNLNTNTHTPASDSDFDPNEVTEEFSFEKEDFQSVVVAGLKERLKTPAILPDEWSWLSAVEWSEKNKFPAEQCLLAFDLLEKIRKKKKETWKINPAIWKANIPRIETLKLELENLENGVNYDANKRNPKPNGNQAGDKSLKTNSRTGSERWKSKEGI